MLAKLQKFFLYLILIFYFIVPIFDIYFYTDYDEKSEKINKIYNTTLKNMPNETQQMYTDFKDSYSSFETFSIISMVISILLICFNFMVVVFVCFSIIEGVKCANTWCFCLTLSQSTANCLQCIIETAIKSPLVMQSIISLIALIINSIMMVKSKKTRGIIKEEITFNEIYNNMTKNEKSIGIVIALLAIVICCSIAKYFFDRYVLKKNAEINVNIPMEVNVPIS